MADVIFQECSWPGVRSVESCRGTVSHGITPGCFTLTTFPQVERPAEFGDLVIGDGVRRVTLRDCKVDSVTGSATAAGQTWTLLILDRRWRWAGGSVSGRYNQQDNRGKLVPWSIRSPEELAKLCLEAMGEASYYIDLPDGLDKAAGADLDEYLRTGENFSQTMANPPVTWDVTNPSRALSGMAEQFGRRLVYQPVRDRVAILPLGQGDPLPDGPLEMLAPSLDAPETPEAVAVAGAPVRLQCRLQLEAVGEDWDGEYLPINLLSYAPTLTPAPQISKATYTGSGDPTLLGVAVTLDPGTPDERETAFVSAAATVAAKLTDVAAQINDDAEAGLLVSASATATELTLTGRTDGEPVWCEPRSLGVPTGESWVGKCTQLAVAPNQKTWAGTHPGNFLAVRATDRLSRAEAVALAQKTVYRCYRIVTDDPRLGVGIKLPWFGEVERRQQIILQPTKVDQVRPMPRDRKGVDKGNLPNEARGKPDFAKDFGGIMPSFYNGYSRDQPATVHGSVSRQIGTVNWNPTGDFNTAVTDKVYVSFAVDPLEQMIVFSEPVYREFKNMGIDHQCEPAVLTLETGVLLLDADTNELVRWTEEKLELGGRGAVEWQLREDIQVGVVGVYKEDEELASYVFEGLEDDARPRARHYLEGMAARYQLTGGETKQYIGIIPVEPDGLRQQVTWSVGPGGATTLASSNSEHDAFVPSYPERRRKENLPPDASARAANREEQRRVDERIPRADERFGP